MAAMEAHVTKGIALHRFGLGSTGNGAEQVMFAEAHVPNQADEARLYCTVARRSAPPGPVISDTGRAGAEDTEWRICPEPIWVSVCEEAGVIYRSAGTLSAGDILGEYRGEQVQTHNHHTATHHNTPHHPNPPFPLRMCTSRYSPSPPGVIAVVATTAWTSYPFEHLTCCAARLATRRFPGAIAIRVRSNPPSP